MARRLGPVISQLPLSAPCTWLSPSSKASYTHAAAAAAGLVPQEPVGPGGGGDSQQRSEEIKRKLDPYLPQHYGEGVTVVHKHGMALLWDPWYNKGETGLQRSAAAVLSIFYR